MNFYTISDKGKVRPNNEDYAESLRLDWCGPLGSTFAVTALILADGMGGAAAGEYASMLAVQNVKKHVVQNLFEKQPEDFLSADKTAFLETWIKEANSAIFSKAAENPELEGMGTTLVAALIFRNSMALAHVGDSRAYRYQNNELAAITKDHSLVQELIDQGKITEKEAFTHPNRNIITRAMGVSAEVQVDRKNLTLQHGDLILICSDGLCGFVENESIKNIVANCYKPQGTNLTELGENLIKAAYLNGGGDNITVCLYQHIAV
ncbi:MAG: Stp1/IreP family PP2C-type Ser/Thr phosphatase [Candidatus Rifleibacteriota bacterium]